MIKHFKLKNLWEAPITTIVGLILTALGAWTIYSNKTVSTEDIALITIGTGLAFAPDKLKSDEQEH